MRTICELSSDLYCVKWLIRYRDSISRKRVKENKEDSINLSKMGCEMFGSLFDVTPVVPRRYLCAQHNRGAAVHTRGKV